MLLSASSHEAALNRENLQASPLISQIGRNLRCLILQKCSIDIAWIMQCRRLEYLELNAIKVAKFEPEVESEEESEEVKREEEEQGGEKGEEAEKEVDEDEEEEEGGAGRRLLNLKTLKVVRVPGFKFSYLTGPFPSAFPSPLPSSFPSPPPILSLPSSSYFTLPLYRIMSMYRSIGE